MDGRSFPFPSSPPARLPAMVGVFFMNRTFTILLVVGMIGGIVAGLLIHEYLTRPSAKVP